MAGIFKSSTRVNAPTPADSALRIQTSVDGLPRQIGWGQSRSTGNLIDYAGFSSAPVASASSGGKGGIGGGGSGKGSSGTGSYNYSAFVQFGIGEGPVLGVVNVWNGSSEVGVASLSAFYTGSYEQAADSAFAASSGHALAYRGLAHADYNPLALGNSASLPNLTFEILWQISGAASGVPDANPADIVADFLTNPNYGAGFPAAFVASAAFAGTASLTTTGVVTAGSASVTGVVAAAQITAGMSVSGPGIPAGATVTSVNATTGAVILSAIATTVTGTLPGGLTAGQTYFWIAQPVDPGENPSLNGQVAASFPDVWTGSFVPFTGSATGTVLMTIVSTGVTVPVFVEESSSEINSPNMVPPASGASVLFSSASPVGPVALVFSGASSTTMPFALFKTYCQAVGLFASDVLTAARAANDYLKEMLTACNGEFVWSSGMLSIVPYGDTGVSGNGATYVPPTAPLFALTDDDFMKNEGTSSVGVSSYTSDDPVICVRTPQSSAYNDIKVEYLDRTNSYNPTIVEAMDDSSVNVVGLRPADTKSWHFFALQGAALMSAQLQLGRQSVRNLYAFTLDQRYIVLDPMDIVAISDAALGLDEQWVRVKEVTENSDGSLTFVAEEYLQGTGAAPSFGAQGKISFAQQYQATAGDTSEVTFYEPPYELAEPGGYQVLITAVPPGAQTAIWAGAEVYVSLDNVEFQHIGTLEGPGTAGSTASFLAADPNVSPQGTPDYQGAASILVTIGDANFYNALSGTSIGAAGVGATLAVIGSEVISYVTATYLGTDDNDVATYELSGLFRNWYGTGGVDIPAGSRFMRLAAPPFFYPYDPSRIGQTIYVKLPSYNYVGGAAQTLDQAQTFTYTLQGPPVPLPPTNASLVATSTGIAISWTPSAAANVHHYEIDAVLPGSGVIGTTTGAQFLWQQFAAGLYVVDLFAIDDGGHRSVPPVQVLGRLFAPDQPSGLTAAFSGADLVLSWNPNFNGSLPIATYEVRQGTSWAGGVKIGSANALQFRTPANWSGAQSFWVAGIDIAGNYGFPSEVTSTIINPAAPSVAPTVFQTFVSFQITGNPASLPIACYSLWRGATFATSVLLHPQITGSFDQYQENTKGTYYYWLTATDTAGNVSPPQGVQATVSNAPNYQLIQNWVSSFSGAIVNGVLEEGALTVPVDISSSWATHFSSESWTDIQDQINAGYPIYVQPTLSSASYTEVFDYGALLGATLITVSVNQNQIAGTAPTVTPDIQVSTNGTTWTDLGNFWQKNSGGSFRYIKVSIAIASADPKCVLALSQLTVSLETLQLTDAGQVTLDANPSGTPFSFNLSFSVVTNISAGVPSGSTIAFVDFANVYGIADPTGGNVFAYDKTGTRITSGTIGWTAVGSSA
jgi:hypothetical protein